MNTTKANDSGITQGVYQIININTLKRYVGSSKDILKRFSQHKNMLQKGIHHSAKLQRSYNASKNKSIFKFEVIEPVENIDELKIREQYYIDKFDSFNNGYNCTALVDNPKYTEKGRKRQQNKQKQTVAYNRFWEMYEKDCIIIGNVYFQRINDKHYGVNTINKLITIMEWFYDSYDKTIYKILIKHHGAMCWMNVCDSYENKFATYCYVKNNIYFSTIDSDTCIDMLRQKGLYNSSIHIPVKTKIDYISFKNYNSKIT